MGKRGNPRISCDPCRRKKVRCDRANRLEAGVPICSYCALRGHLCAITDDAHVDSATSFNTTTTTTTTSRSATSTQQTTPSLSSGSSSVNQLSPSSDVVLSVHGRSSPETAPTSPFLLDSTAFLEDAINIYASALLDGLPNKRQRTSPVTSFLGVEGLDRPTLDKAVDLYFRYAACCNLIVLAEHFMPRYSAFFDHLVGQPCPIEPASQVLVLAVACAGLAQLREREDRFLLQERMVRRVEQIVLNPAEYRTIPLLDYLEAASVLTDVPYHFYLLDEWRSKHNNDPLRIHPLSYDAIVKLILHHGLNLTPNGEDPETGSVPTLTQGVELRSEPFSWIRRRLIFWSTWANDVFRRHDCGQLTLILEEDMDVLMLPRQVHTASFREWANQAFALAAVIRNANRSINSARSKRVGAPADRVISFITTLKRWRSLVPQWLCFWSNLSAEAAPPVHFDPEAVRRAFLEMLYLSHIVSLHSILYVSGIHGDDAKTAREMVDAELLSHTERLVRCAEASAARGYMNVCPLVLRTAPFGSSTYLVLLAQTTMRDSAKQLLDYAHRLGVAISTVTTVPQSKADSAHVLDSVAAARQNLGFDFTSAPTTVAPTPTPL